MMAVEARRILAKAMWLTVDHKPIHGPAHLALSRLLLSQRSPVLQLHQERIAGPMKKRLWKAHLHQDAPLRCKNTVQGDSVVLGSVVQALELEA